MRFEIDSKWTALDFSGLMSQCQFLYDAALLVDMEFEGQPLLNLLSLDDSTDPSPFIVVDRAQRTPNDLLREFVVRLQVESILTAVPHHHLEVRKIVYGSPGIVDLAGIGKVIEQLRIFTTDIVDRVLHKEDRKIARELAQQELLAKKIANAKKLLKLGSKAGLNEKNVQALIAQVVLSDALLEHDVEQHRITSVRTLD
jgi:hypothetical protein